MQDYKGGLELSPGVEQTFQLLTPLRIIVTFLASELSWILGLVSAILQSSDILYL